MSGADHPFAFDTGSPRHRTESSRSAGQLQRLNLEDMFRGKDKEHVFPLVPGEDRIDELEFNEMHLFFVRRGIVRVTLTTHRLLYTKTRVFSPFYWLLLVLFFPLIFYYLFRISRNMSVAIPLRSIDSYEKRYFPNWALLIVAAFLGYLVAGIFVFPVMMAFDKPQDSLILVWTIRSVVLGVIGPALLVLLLATRSVGIKILSSNNYFSFGGGVEERIDAFLQNMQAAMERAKSLHTPANAVGA